MDEVYKLALKTKRYNQFTKTKLIYLSVCIAYEEILLNGMKNLEFPMDHILLQASKIPFSMSPH